MIRPTSLPAKLPTAIFSVLGDIPVTMCHDLCEKKTAIGMISFRTRQIEVQTGLAKETMWPTFFHEMTHLALNDAGTADVISCKQQESVCNAMGLYLTAAMQAGYLKVATP